MARKVLFVKQTVSGFHSNTNYGGLYTKGFNFPESGHTSSPIDSFTLEVGKTYIVDWDGMEYEVVGQDASALGSEVALGNGSAFGLSGNNEPFGITCTNGSGVTFVSLTETVDSHTIGLYQEIADEEPEEEEHIVLKDRNGNDILFQGINMIKLPTTGGGTKTFAACDDVEKTVAPDFSDGDFVVLPDTGTLLSKVTVEKPENLSPENIRKGKEVAGVTGSAFVVDMVETAVFEEQEVSGFGPNSTYGGYSQSIAPAPFALTIGETYYVEWDNVSYSCVAQDANAVLSGAVVLGNASKFGLAGNNEPFIIACLSYGVMFLAFEDSTSHIIGISQTSREDAETAYVELDFADDNQVVTPSASDKVLTKVTIEKPKTLTPANIAKGVEVAGVVGELAAETEEVTVGLDFSNGAMEVTPTGDKAFSKVNIPVPSTLIPENIAEGVDIAGIIGTLVAGSNNGGIVSATVTKDGGGTITVTHGLGVVPDIVFVFANYSTLNATNATLAAAGISTAAYNAGIRFPPNYRWYLSSSKLYLAGSSSGRIDQTNTTLPIFGANEKTVKIYSTSYNYTYTCYFIGGLT